MNKELVFACPTREIWNLLTYNEQGLIPGSSGDLKKIVRIGLFRRRDELEEDPSFKQIIPYGVISCQESFFLFKRKAGQAEKRLQDLYSLGVGGHMNPGRSTEPPEQYLIDELKRELFEEVSFSNDCSIESIDFKGFINDETIPVSRVHLGLYYNISVSNRNLEVSETDKLTGTWIERSALDDFYEGIETWTRIIVDCCIR